MKRSVKKTIVMLIAGLMMFETCDTCIAYAADEIGKVIDPTRDIVLEVPEKYQDGGNWFFVAQPDWSVSEKSNEPMYIPIQRTGDLDSEAEVTLKLTDLSAKHDVNYRAELYKDDAEPEIAGDDMSLKEIALSEDFEQEEFKPAGENELGEMIHEMGGADITDSSGAVVGSVKATPLDENGNPVAEEKQTDGETAPLETPKAEAPESGDARRIEKEEAPAAETERPSPSAEPDYPVMSPLNGSIWEEPVPEEAEELEETAAETETAAVEMSPTDRLRAARSAYTGKASDRQEMKGGDLSDLAKNMTGNMMSENELGKELADAADDNSPGTEYVLHFNAGEEAKYLKVTPIYSEAGEGDAQIWMMLKDPSGNYALGEDTNPVVVTIIDEDEPEQVTISMAEENVTAIDGKARITVTREGRLNAIKGVTVTSWGGSAKPGDEYSGIGAELYFPMGTKSRTVEIPVYHGTEEKDFNVTITPLNDETIGTASAHVIIPAAQTAGGSDGELMGVSDIDGKPFSGNIDISKGWFTGPGTGGFDSKTQVHLSTHANKEEDSHFWISTSDFGSAYDGIYLDYKGFVNWCDADYRLVRWDNNNNANRVHVNYFDDGGIKDNCWLYGYWGDVKAPSSMSIEACNVDTEGPVGSDSYAAMWVHGVKLIRRQFDIKVENPEVKPIIGMNDDQILNNYEAVMLDNSTYNSRTLWTEDSFALTAKDTKSPLRLVGIEAKVRQDGKDAWYRIATIDGKSDTAVVKMTKDNVNAMAAKGCIEWSENGSGNGGKSYKGAITVRPVFDYINAAVELKAADPDYGSIHIKEPTPSMLWDFGSDRKMDEKMGVDAYYKTNQVSWTGESNNIDDYYTFTASGSDPFVPVITHAESLDNIRYIKVRAKNLSGVSNIQLYGSVNNGALSANTNINIPLESDSGWHEYVIDMKNAPEYKEGAWNGRISYLRLDPMDGNTGNGSQIQIDYMAFFPDEMSANAFRSGDNGAYKPGTYTYHLGDKLQFNTEINDAGTADKMLPDGVSYELRRSGKNGELVNYNDIHYINGSVEFQLNGDALGGSTADHPYYGFKPIFTENRNRITVKVPEQYYDNYLDTTKGIFAAGNYESVTHRAGAYYYVIAEGIRTNDIYELDAYTKDAEKVIPKWILSDNSEYFGNSMYIMSNPRADDNMITLTTAEGSHLTYMTLSGTVVTSTMNLASGRSATDKNPVKGAVVSLGMTGGIADEKGKFTVPAVLYDSDAKVRFLVTYNGVTTIQEARVPSNRAEKTEATTITGKKVQAVTADAGMVRTDTYSETGARFVSAVASQRGQLQGALHALTLNGNQLLVSVKVDKGGEYTINNQTYTEHIKDVTLYFMDQETGEIHGQFSSNEKPSKDAAANWTWDESKGEFLLEIYSFDPNHPASWTYGDVLMAKLTTDRKTAMNSMGGEKSAAGDMVYDPVSTGYGVYADPNFQPRVFDYHEPDTAAKIGVTPKTTEDGKLLEDKEDIRYSYGSFPYIGEIQFALHYFNKVISSEGLDTATQNLLDDINEMSSNGAEDEDDSGDSDDGPVNPGKKQSARRAQGSVNMFFLTEKTSYGGVRFKFGFTVSFGGGSGYVRRDNPYDTMYGFVKNFKKNMSAPTVETSENDIEYIYNGKGGRNGSITQDAASRFMGLHFSVSPFFGGYLDYGYIEISRNGGKEKSHDMVYMGGGGIAGFTGEIGYNFQVMLGPVPAYFNPEANMDVTFFIGTSADPKKTLASFYDTKVLKGQDFGFNFEIKGRVWAGGSIGVGLYKFIGVRVTAGIGFELAYSPKIPKWYPQKFESPFGYVAEATFAGTLDLFITSIDIYSASWPLPIGDGFLRYFQEVRRGNLCISLVENGIKNAQSKGEVSSGEVATARSMINELVTLIDNDSADTQTVRTKTTALKDYAYDHNMLSWVAKNRIDMNKQGGIVGSAIDGSLQDDTDKSGIRFHTNEHVDPQWVANDGRLAAAFSAVESTPLIENAYSQPSSKIVNLGGGRFLMVFLDDTASRDKQQAATLKWTVYDGSAWSEPQTVQNDSTADGKPSLADAGDKVILSWASMTDDKYNTLKETVRKELSDAGKSDTDVDVQEFLEKNPTRVMANMDIFTAEFDKAAGSFREPTQLTDDAIYDDNPQVVYDSETKDYIVLYYKTAQDDGDYSSEGDKLLDAVGASADPNKSYSVIAYMLYNGTKEEDDPFDVGWVTTGLYDNELPEGQTSEGYVAKYGPERYLPSAITYDDGGEYTDPPIFDLTAAQGYNGLAAYAFTVDKDFDLNTTADRELYLQYYDFATHSNFVPVCVAGSTTVETETYNEEKDEFETVESTVQIDVGSPKLVRNGGSTFLFWREGDKTLKYLNVSELLNAKVAAVSSPSTENEDDWKYALSDDGTFETDAATGIKYEPKAEYVDFGGMLTDGGIEMTDYEVISDKDDNLYVVWTDTVTRAQTDELGNAYPVNSQAIYASAMIHQDEKTETYNDEGGNTQTSTNQTVSWSKPYRLTREDNYNDGLALTLDDEGNLMIVHNQFTKQRADSDDEVMQLIKDGKLGIAYDKEGNAYAPTISYNSPVTLMVTKCEKIGSLEATVFEYSDDHPVPGQVIKVTAAMENVGLTDAEGSEIEFYEYKDGVLGNKIYGLTSDDRVQVNTAKKVSFLWRIPDEGAEGYQIAAVVKEKNSSGGYYPAVTSYSNAFESAPQYTLNVNSITQEGDKFRVDYSVTNTGNAPVPEGTSVSLKLVGLYGDLDSERYGNIKDNELYSTELSLGAKTAESDTAYISADDGEKEKMASTVTNTEFRESVLVDIPASVFHFCGYDAIQLVIKDKDGNSVEESDQNFINLVDPVNLNMNNGEAISLNGDETKQVALDYDSTVFMAEGKVVYTVDDPSIASVKEDGTVKGIKNGTTELTATILPSGRSTSVELNVSGIKQDSFTVTFAANGGSGEMADQTLAADAQTALTANAFTRSGYTFTGWNTEADGSGTAYSNGQEITPTEDMTLYAQWRRRSSGGGGGGSSSGGASATAVPSATAEPDTTPTAEPASGNEERFIDVKPDDWFYDAVNAAADQGIVNGMTDNTYEPQRPLTRAMFAAMLHRYDGSEASQYEYTFEDVPSDEWYTEDIRWATEHGIITGYDDSTFGPDDTITREQAVAMMYRYTGYKGIDTSAAGEEAIAGYSDNDTISGYAREPFAWACGAGVINGREDNILAPLDSITRAEIAQIFVNYMNNIG